MPLSVVLLVLVSCVVHAGWNLQVKRREVGPAFFLAAGVFVLIPAAPFFFALGGAETVRAAPAALWPILAITGACQAAYYTCLSLAYRNGDVSVVYPVARTAPLFVIPLSGLIQHRWPAPVALLGIVLAVAGCFLLPRKTLSLRAEPFAWSAYAGPGTLWAVATAVASSGYTVADAVGVGLIAPIAPGLRGAFLYACLEWLASSLFLPLAVRVAEGNGRRARGSIARALRTRRSETFALGAAIFGAYLLILWAYSLTDRVAYVAGMRQFSVALGVLGGIRFLNEPRDAPRIAGALVILGGLVLVAFSR